MTSFRANTGQRSCAHSMRNASPMPIQMAKNWKAEV
jgi:hypothetical protein